MDRSGKYRGEDLLTAMAAAPSRHHDVFTTGPARVAIRSTTAADGSGSYGEAAQRALGCAVFLAQDFYTSRSAKLIGRLCRVSASVLPRSSWAFSTPP